MKEKSKNCNMRWKIFMYATFYKCGTKRCDLCLTEIYIIARGGQEHLSNKRTEIISKCCHINKYLVFNKMLSKSWEMNRPDSLNKKILKIFCTHSNSNIFKIKFISLP